MTWNDWFKINYPHNLEDHEDFLDYFGDNPYFALPDLSNVDDLIILQKLSNVDGDGSELDADMVDGRHVNDSIETTNNLWTAVKISNEINNLANSIDDIYVHRVGNIQEDITGIKTFVDDVIIQGNLEIQGNVTEVNTVELRIEDALITLNSNLTDGTPPSSLISGIEVLRGTLETVRFVWVEALQRWVFYQDLEVASDLYVNGKLHISESITVGQDITVANNLTVGNLINGVVVGTNGSGGGLDADTLDGSHASDFALAIHNHDDLYYRQDYLDTILAQKEDISNKVSVWSSIPNDTNYPTEKLVKDSLDSKADINHNHIIADITDFPPLTGNAGKFLSVLPDESGLFWDTIQQTSQPDPLAIYFNITNTTPTTNDIPPDVGYLWLNTDTGEIFVCTYIDINTNKATWIGQLGTVVIPAGDFNIADIFGDGSIDGFWRFDGNLDDDTGNYYPFQTNGYVGYSSGLHGSAVLFSGGNSIYNDYFSINENFSFSLWVKPNSTSTVTQPVLQLVDGNGYNILEFGLPIRTSWQWWGQLYYIKIANIYTMSFSSVDTSNFIHFVISYDGDNSILRLYRNGVLVGERANTTINTDDVTMVILGQDFNRQYSFYGLVDNLRLFNKALSQAEVSYLYQQLA